MLTGKTESDETDGASAWLGSTRLDLLSSPSSSEPLLRLRLAEGQQDGTPATTPMETTRMPRFVSADMCIIFECRGSEDTWTYRTV